MEFYQEKIMVNSRAPGGTAGVFGIMLGVKGDYV